MKFSIAALALMALPAAAIELTPANFDEVTAGKVVFIKMFAPWCGHCKKMKPDWDSLGSTYADSTKVLIGDVDCTAAGKPLCDKYGVRGYPTIKYFNPPDEDGEDYKGGRDLPALKKFVDTELGPGCSVDSKENCSAEQLAELQTYTDMMPSEREAKLTALKDALKKAEDEHNDLLKKLQEQFKTSQDALEKLKEESGPTMKMLRAATPKSGTVADKDEV